MVLHENVTTSVDEENTKTQIFLCVNKNYGYTVYEFSNPYPLRKIEKKDPTLKSKLCGKYTKTQILFFVKQHEFSNPHPKELTEYNSCGSNN